MDQCLKHCVHDKIKLIQQYITPSLLGVLQTS